MIPSLARSYILFNAKGFSSNSGYVLCSLVSCLVVMVRMANMQSFCFCGWIDVTLP